MDMRGRYTHNEIYSQPEAWVAALDMLSKHRRAIRDYSQPKQYQQIIFTGCGSTYYLSIAAATLFQEMTGLSAQAFPASELWLSPSSSYPSSGRILLVAISRSGETTETVRACEAFNGNGKGDIITFVCYPESRIAKLGKLNLIFPSGMETSVAQTRAFSTLYLGIVGLCALWSDQSNLFEHLIELPRVGGQLLNKYTALAKTIGQNEKLDQIYYLGSGSRYGLACELNLKMKEMSLTHSEAFHFLEFRHGPKSMVNPNTLIVGLISEKNSFQEFAVLDDVRQLGGVVLSIGESQSDVSFQSGVEEVIRNILYLPFGQMLAFERSLTKGLDPDRPKNLDSVVIL